jgi:hypothetical protein
MDETEFQVRSQVGTSGQLQSIDHDGDGTDSNPTVDVWGDGSGSMTTPTVTLRRTRTDVTLEFTYKPKCTMGGGSRITLTVPDSFSAPIETETLDVPGSVNIIDSNR